MTDKPQIPEGQIQVNSKKIFAAPNQEPIVFVNAAEFSAAGMDVFMDLGVVPVDSVGAAIKASQEHPDVPPEMEFHVSHRFAMSFQGAVLIHQRLTQLLQQSNQQISALKEQQVKLPGKEGKP